MKHSRCPYDCPTPYPHSLTSISLLVSPRQIRKASQHLHGDRPQSSRWPQCAARQLKRKRRAGKWKWVRTGEGGGDRNVNLPVPQARARTHALVALSGACAHACSCLTAPSPAKKTKQKTNTRPLRQSQSISGVRMKRGVGGDRRSAARNKLAPWMGRSQSFHWRVVRHPSTPVTNPATQSMGLTLQIPYSGILNQTPSYLD